MHETMGVGRRIGLGSGLDMRGPSPSTRRPALRLFLEAALAVSALVALSACRLPEQRQAFYPNGFLKERYWVYREGGSEVMHGLYTGWFPNGEREVEILYRDGSEVTKTYFSDQGRAVGTLDLASNREP
jgi:hypothetical protein